MISLKLTELQALFPEFSTLSDTRFKAVSAVAALQVNEKVFGSKAQYALALLTAHILKFSASAKASGGPVTMEKIGDMERQFGQFDAKAGAGLYAGTTYGVLFVQLRRTVFTGPLVT